MVMMRVYELARSYGLQSKDLLTALREAGFSVASHMSFLAQNELDFLEKKFASSVPLKASVEEKKEQAKAPVKAEKPTVSEGASKEAFSKSEKVEKKISAQEQQPVIEKSEKEAKAVTQPTIVKSLGREQVRAESTVRTSESVKKTATLGEPQELVIVPMTLAEFAEKIRMPATEVILTLLKLGTMATKNQMLNEQIIEQLANHYQIKAKKMVAQDLALQDISMREGEFQERPPVIVVLGHVDHGKTTLLDYIRKTRVAAKEKGGITQHLGAYEVHTSQGDIIFLDTPGHAAFTKIRGRGVGVADIAILVVAADDGIMPQTDEAIKYAKAAEIPIIVAINKIDKVDPSRLGVIKQELSQRDLLPEEWGGSTVCVPISAKLGTGVDQLLEIIILQAQLMELRADDKGSGVGYVLESKLEKGRGVVATLICKQGKVQVGDYFVCGNTVGKINSLIDTFGRRVIEAGPAVPVQVAGFEELPDVGSIFKVVTSEEYRKMKLMLGSRKDFVQKNVQEGAHNLLIKTDTFSSKEALLGSLAKLSKDIKQEFNIVAAGIGPVSEGDVMLAASTNADIITLHVKPETNAASMARNYNVSIQTFDIIYKLLEALEEKVKRAQPVKMVATKIGEAIVRQVFSIKNVGVIAGCYVQDGRFVRDGKVIVWRRDKKIGEGKITSLQRERKSVKEIHAGFECGFVAEGLEDYAVDDRVECYVEMPAKQ